MGDNRNTELSVQNFSKSKTILKSRVYFFLNKTGFSEIRVTERQRELVTLA